MDLKNLLFSFQGRISRQPYWLFYLGVFVIQVVLVRLLYRSDLGRIVLVLVFLAVIWSTLAVNVKRWHDRDKSGWWLLISFVPIIGQLWMLIELGFLRGTDGPNRFGPDPHEELKEIANEVIEKLEEKPSSTREVSSPDRATYGCFAILIGVTIVTIVYAGSLIIPKINNFLTKNPEPPTVIPATETPLLTKDPEPPTAIPGTVTPLPTDTQVTTDAPFVGLWVSVDPVDGSNQRLSINGGNGVYAIVYFDDVAESCGLDGAGNLIGASGTSTGYANGNFLSTDISYWCQSDPQSFLATAHVNLTYDEISDTLTDRRYPVSPSFSWGRR